VYTQRLPYVVKTLSQKAHVLVDTGDCTEHGNGSESAEYASIIAGEASVPWRAVPGNHDTPEVFGRHIGPIEWSWDLGAYRLIGINTESINYAALDSALTHGKTCIVFGHFPLSWCTPEDQARLRQRFQTYDVPIYISGHTHLDSAQVDTQSGTLLLTGQRAGLGHYRLITLHGTQVVDIAFENAWN
jgi:predicted phosphodiesterase